MSRSVGAAQHQQLRQTPSNSSDLSSADTNSNSNAASPTTSTYPTNNSATHLSYTIELFENERWFPLSGWCAKRLPSDRPHFSSKDGKQEIDPIRWVIPNGYEWIGDWSVDKEHRHGCDADGWRYGFAWGTNFQATMSPSTFVRRRRWIRTMIKSPTTTTNTAAPAAAASAGTSRAQSQQQQQQGASSAPMPANVYSVNNESFDVCSVPVAQSRRKVNRGGAETDGASDSNPPPAASNVAQQQPQQKQQQNSMGTTTPAHASSEAATRSSTADKQVNSHHVDPDVEEDEDVNHTGDLHASASMRYFAERSATSSVINGNRNQTSSSAMATSPEQQQQPVVALGGGLTGVEAYTNFEPSIISRPMTTSSATTQQQQPVATATLPAKSEFAPTPERSPEVSAIPHHAASTALPVFHFGNGGYDDDEDAAFYGYGTTAPAPTTSTGIVVGGAIQLVPTQSGGGDDLSFQRTLTEIVEDVDRSVTREREVDEGVGWSMAPPPPPTALGGSSSRRFGSVTGEADDASHTTNYNNNAATTNHFGGTNDDDDDDDAFSNMMAHFVSKANTE